MKENTYPIGAVVVDKNYNLIANMGVEVIMVSVVTTYFKATN
ncbi:hypothetical protein [Chengkuizengella axinellae]|uniref:Uncharacterized protein n=1 Tax=Chengkuizengella axinellae TaxID=3064388 RepID=A0ABT9J6S9_9BACL|nr:hypothetical protein [Chengkuizengella sp. 2205SS18-9]MDP5276720.1 hypothetical protein [Chengkuizengella sp. 2205SS18-9]